MIHKTSRGYALLKSLVNFIHTLFYRRIYVNGLENIPQNTPIIFGPNHQNALMDPLALLLNIPHQPVFLARADIFKSAFTRPILRFMKILPVYRVRDGFSSLENNTETFDESIAVLEAKKPLALFPEAKHNNKRYLLPLKKGIPRIALLAEEKNNFNMNLKVVPVGIHYSDYYNASSDLWVQIGEPIPVDDLKESYNKNPQQTHLLLRDKIADAIKPLILNIENTNYYDEYLLIIAIADHYMRAKLSIAMGDNEHNLLVKQKIVSHIDSKDNSTKEKILDIAKTLLEDLQRHKLLSSDLAPESNVTATDVLRLIITAPLFIIGYFTALPHLIIPWFFYHKLKDRQFESSFKFAFQLLLSPLTYGIISFYLLPKFFEINLFIAIGLFFILFYAGAYAMNYIKLFRKVLRRIRVNPKIKKNSTNWNALQKLILDEF